MNLRSHSASSSPFALVLPLSLALSLGLCGCGDDDGRPAGTDAGTADAGSGGGADAGDRDAGSTTTDAGATTTDGGGVMTDAGGSLDAGSAPDGSTVGRGCGARLGDTCGASEYCDFPAGALCGAADGTGVCATRPTACTADVNPVCGCDGMDYTNPCNAHAAGTDDATMGMCAIADCRTTGCSSGSTCMLCFTVYSCLPDGAVC